MIEVQGLTKRYGYHARGGRAQLRRAAGEVTGFLGPNGSGKSTTMRLIMGLDTARRGAGPHRRPPLPRAALAAARGRGAARGQGVPPGPERAQRTWTRWPPATASAAAGSRRCLTWSAWPAPPASGPGSSRSAWRSAWDRGGAAGRPARCCCWTSRSTGWTRRDPLDPRPAEVAGRAGPHGVRLQPPDQRDRAAGRAPGGDRPGPAARRHHGRPSCRPAPRRWRTRSCG